MSSLGIAGAPYPICGQYARQGGLWGLRAAVLPPSQSGNGHRKVPGAPYSTRPGSSGIGDVGKRVSASWHGKPGGGPRKAEMRSRGLLPRESSSFKGNGKMRDISGTAGKGWAGSSNRRHFLAVSDFSCRAGEQRRFVEFVCFPIDSSADLAIRFAKSLQEQGPGCAPTLGKMMEMVSRNFDAGHFPKSSPP